MGDPATAGVIPNPNLAFGQPDGFPGQPGGTNWQATELRGVIAYQQDQSSPTNASTVSAVAITGCFALILCLNQPLEITWGGEFYNNTALDGVKVQLTKDTIPIGPNILVFSSTASAISSPSVTFTDNTNVYGSTHLYGLQFTAVTGGTAGLAGTAAGGTGAWLQVREG